MTQVFSWIAVLRLLSVLSAPAPPSFAPDEEYNGPTLNGGIGGHQGPSLNGAYVGQQGPSLNGTYAGHQGPSLNGAPLQAQDPRIRGFAVEAVELPDGTTLDRPCTPGVDVRRMSSSSPGFRLME